MAYIAMASSNEKLTDREIEILKEVSIGRTRELIHAETLDRLIRRGLVERAVGGLLLNQRRTNALRDASVTLLWQMFDDTPPTGPRTAFESIVSPLWLWRLCNVLPKPIGIVVVLVWLLFLLCAVIFALHGVLDGFGLLPLFRSTFGTGDD